MRDMIQKKLNSLEFAKACEVDRSAVKGLMDKNKHQSLLNQLKQRISAPQINDTSLNGLERLRSAFSEVVPYENLTVLNEAFVSLRPEDVLTKFSQKRVVIVSNSIPLSESC